MPLTKPFHESIVELAKSDRGYRRELLRESVTAILNNEFGVGHSLIRDYVKSVRYLDALAKELDLEDGVATLFDPDVNPSGIHLLSALSTMLREEGLSLTTRRQLDFSRPRLS